MKKVILPLIIVLMSSTLLAQHSLEKIWETDSVTLKNPESVLFDPISNSLYISSMSAGAIVRYGLDGKLIQNNWVTGLTANKGSAIFNGLLFTAENTSVAVIDIKKAAVIKHIQVEGAVMLNDLAVDSKGIIYVSDSRGAKVYRIEGDKPTVYLENMTGANGLLPVGTDLYVLTSTRVDKVSDSKQITKIADGFESGLDGIVMVGENEFIISNYKGILYWLKADGTSQVLLDTREKHAMSNDIGYDSKTKTLYVPSFATNFVTAYKVK
jgi:DNA-binding beta-propeller fold protein YncE